MEKVIYNLVFNRKKQLNAEGKALIQVEAYLNRQKRYFFNEGLCETLSMGQQETFHKESSEYGCVKPVSSELCYGVGER